MAADDTPSAPRARGNPFLRTTAALSMLAGWVAAAMLIAAVGITCEMIFVRFVLNASTTWQSEAVIYLVIGTTMIGLSYVQSVGGHVNVDFLPLMLPARARFMLVGATRLLAITIIAVMLYYGWQFWYYAWVRGWHSDSVWGVRLWIPYLSVPVGFALLLLQMIAEFYQFIIGMRPARPARHGVG